MKLKLLISIIAVVITVQFLLPAKYETVVIHSGNWKINADRLMRSSDYYFMCIPIQGYLIKKQQPKFDITDKEIHIPAVFHHNQSFIQGYINNNPDWYKGFEYRKTTLNDTNDMGPDLFVKDLGNKFLVAFEYPPRGRSKGQIDLPLTVEKDKYIGVKKEDYGIAEYILPYDDLVQLAKNRCKTLGIEE